MKQKQLIVISIVVILAIIACLAAFFIVNSHEESISTHRISNSCTVGVPLTNNTVEHAGNGVVKFIFDENDLNVTHQKTENNSEIKQLNTKQIKNSDEVEDGIYYDGATGIYSTFIENNDTGDAILITAKDLNLLKRVSKSVKFTTPTELTISENTTIEESVEEVYYEPYYDDYYPNYEQSYQSVETPSEPAQEETPSSEQK